MPHVSGDRIKDTSTTTGTGDITVSGTAATGYKTFSQIPGIAVSDTFYYAIVHQTLNEWEVGIGSWSGSNVFARTATLAGTNGTSAVNFSAGTKDCFVTFPADYNVSEIQITDAAVSGLDAANGNGPITDLDWRINLINPMGSLPASAADLSLVVYDEDGLEQGKANFAAIFDAYEIRKITISTSAASGGADGDIWFQVPA